MSSWSILSGGENHQISEDTAGCTKPGGWDWMNLMKNEARGFEAD